MIAPSRPVIIAFLSTLCLIFLYLQFSPSARIHVFRQPVKKNYAYTTFLAAPWDVENATAAADSDDHYYMQTRMLLYQLLHDPTTRSYNNYPFVVLATEDVTESKRKRLAYEGAIVKVVEKLSPLQHKTRERWQDMMTKLRLFEMVEYDKVVFFDSDTILTRPVDGMFDDPAASSPQPNKNLNTPNSTQPDEAPQPSTYLFASRAGAGPKHTLPPHTGQNLNGGVLVYKPSLELFNYYLSLTTPEAEARYNAWYNEQGLWAYAHRLDGNMPWTQLDWKWNINWADDVDLEMGIASLHCKYWELEGEGKEKLRRFAMSVLWRMEGFWEGVERR